MFEDFPLPLAMPLGTPSGDFTALQNGYVLETVYGLRDGSGAELESRTRLAYPCAMTRLSIGSTR